LKKIILIKERIIIFIQLLTISVIFVCLNKADFILDTFSDSIVFYYKLNSLLIIYLALAWYKKSINDSLAKKSNNNVLYFLIINILAFIFFVIVFLMNMWQYNEISFGFWYFYSKIYYFSLANFFLYFLIAILLTIMEWEKANNTKRKTTLISLNVVYFFIIISIYYYSNFLIEI
jgi:hypothetical protein